MNDRNHPLVSIIVPAHPTTSGLSDCLGALLDQTADPSTYEILVVDNAPEPSNVTELCADYSLVTVLHEPRPGSYAARNTGAAEARGSLLAFIDADCLPTEDWVEEGVRYGQEHPDLAAWTGPVDMTPRSSEDATPSGAELYERVFAFPQHEYVTKLGFAGAGNLWCRSSDFRAVGAFEPELQSGGDYEWGIRLGRSGRRLGYNPHLRVRHPPRRTISGLARKKVRTRVGALQVRLSKSPRTRTDRFNYLLFTLKPIVPPLRGLFTTLRTPRLSGAGERTRCAVVLLLIRIVEAVVSIRYLGHAFSGEARQTLHSSSSDPGGSTPMSSREGP